MINILDSGILMNTNVIPDIEGQIYIPSSVLEEIKSAISTHVYNLFSSKHNITMLDPLKKYKSQVKKVAKNIGQTDLSSTDLDVLALALQLKTMGRVMIYSDDYGLRNVAHEMNISSKGITTSGGDQKRIYTFTCQACGTTYKGSVDACDTCGHSRFDKNRIK